MIEFVILAFVAFDLYLTYSIRCDLYKELDEFNEEQEEILVELAKLRARVKELEDASNS
jgi:hypothetical protein